MMPLERLIHAVSARLRRFGVHNFGGSAYDREHDKIQEVASGKTAGLAPARPSVCGPQS